MALPWVRLDSNIAIHDKILALMADPSPKRHQAAASYMFALAWCGAAERDGDIPAYALPTVHGSAAAAALLVKYRLWTEVENGYAIRNYEQYQQLAQVTENKRQAAHVAGVKANCVRWHGEGCGCWKVKAA